MRNGEASSACTEVGLGSWLVSVHLGDSARPFAALSPPLFLAAARFSARSYYVWTIPSLRALITLSTPPRPRLILVCANVPPRSVHRPPSSPAWRPHWSPSSATIDNMIQTHLSTTPVPPCGESDGSKPMGSPRRGFGLRIGILLEGGGRSMQGGHPQSKTMGYAGSRHSILPTRAWRRRPSAPLLGILAFGNAGYWFL